MKLKMNSEQLAFAPGNILPQKLVRWVDTSLPYYPTEYSIEEQSCHSMSPFPFECGLNQKIILW